MGLLLAVVITAASVQDRDAARPLLWNLHRVCRHIRLVWADAVYAGKLSIWAASLKMTLCIVARRNPHAFEVLPRKWDDVERTFAWISKHCRTTRDYERLPASHEAMILWAMIALTTCRLAQPGGGFLRVSRFAIRRARSVSCSVPLWSWRALVSRGEVAVAVNQMPLAVLPAIDLRDPQPLAGHRRPVKDHVTDLVANRVRQVGTLVHDLVFVGDHAFAIAAGNPVEGLLELVPALLAGTEGTEQRHVIPARPQRLVGLGVTQDHRRFSSLLPRQHGRERRRVACCHNIPLPRTYLLGGW